MTTVTICKDHAGAYKGFYCMGHAEYAKRKEPDILCSAISVTVIGAINALDELAGESLTVSENPETGFIKCDFLSPLQEKSNFLVDSMVFTLENLSKKYGKAYLQVQFKEV